MVLHKKVLWTYTQPQVNGALCRDLGFGIEGVVQFVVGVYGLFGGLLLGQEVNHRDRLFNLGYLVLEHFAMLQFVHFHKLVFTVLPC